MASKELADRYCNADGANHRDGQLFDPGGVARHALPMSGATIPRVDHRRMRAPLFRDGISGEIGAR